MHGERHGEAWGPPEHGETWGPPEDEGWAPPHRGRGRGRGPGSRRSRPHGPDFGPMVAFTGFGGWPGEPRFRRSKRVRRGDVRAAALSLLAEEPRNGYQVIQEIAERSGGLWQPSPGSVYPALQQLEDEGLIQAETPEGGRRRYVLTSDGTRSTWTRMPRRVRAPWDDVVAAVWAQTPSSLRHLVGQVAMWPPSRSSGSGTRGSGGTGPQDSHRCPPRAVRDPGGGGPAGGGRAGRRGVTAARREPGTLGVRRGARQRLGSQVDWEEAELGRRGCCRRRGGGGRRRPRAADGDRRRGPDQEIRRDRGGPRDRLRRYRWGDLRAHSARTVALASRPTIKMLCTLARPTSGSARVAWSRGDLGA